jgi:phage-related minor tail protein
MLGSSFGAAGGNTFLPSASFVDHGFGFADGGYTGNGPRSAPAGVVHGGEFVFSAPRVQQLGVPALSRLHKGYADGGFVDNVPSLPMIAPMASRGGMGGNFNMPVHVVVTNEIAGAQVETKTSQRSDGAPQIDLRIIKRMITDEVAGDIRSGQGDVHRAMSDRFGLNPRL